MTFPTRLVRSALLAKGFVERDGDHEYFHFRAPGRTKTFTKISHGAREVEDNLITQMARQMRLTRKQFAEFVECTMTGEKYSELMAESQQEKPAAKPPEPPQPPRKRK